MRQVMELEPGDHVEHMGITGVVEDVEIIPEATGGEPGYTPLVPADAVWLTLDTVPRHLADGRREFVVTGCDGCDSRHPADDCPRRSA